MSSGPNPNSAKQFILALVVGVIVMALFLPLIEVIKGLSGGGVLVRVVSTSGPLRGGVGPGGSAGRRRVP